MPTFYTSGLAARGTSGPPGPAGGPTEARIREVVEVFYGRARSDALLGPVFAAHIGDWGEHLGRMTDFWSSVLLGSGRYFGRPMEAHRAIGGLSADHFDRWIALFEATVRDVASPAEAEAFMDRARRMRGALERGLGPEGAR